MRETEGMFNFPIPSVEWAMIMPVAILALSGILALLVETIRPRRAFGGSWAISILGLMAAGNAIAMQFSLPDGETLGGLLIRDNFALVIQLLLIGSAFLCVLFSRDYLLERRIALGEFFPLILWSTCGAMVMVSTHNLLVMFVGLEILSIALYVLAGMARRDNRSQESALKYFLLGAFASAFLLYGIAFFYGASGSLDARAVTAAWDTANPPTRGLLVFGGALMLVGFGFKASFVPFHQWTPDVYQGAPTNVAAFMASASKVAAIATLWRVLDDGRVLAAFYLPALYWMAVLTMTVGNVVALLQKDVKRILGYSSIAHAGYVLVAICANLKEPGRTSVSTIVYYLVAYALMTIGSFAVVAMVAKDGKEGTRLDDIRGLRRHAPLAAWALIVFMISLLGMPPTAGFFGKLFIFQDALSAGLPWLAFALAVNSAISAYYYLGIAHAAYVAEEGDAATAKMGIGMAWAAVLCLMGVVMASFFLPSIIGQIGR